MWRKKARKECGASKRRAKEVREEGKGEGKHLYERFGGMTSN